MELDIRPYTAADAVRLSDLRNQIPGNSPRSAADFQAYLAKCEHSWVGLMAGLVVGYTAVAPVPGLPHVRMLNGFITPAWQRQGLGSQLLHHLIQDLKSEVPALSLARPLQLSYCTGNTESAVYHFLRRHHFFTEHKEQHLILSITAPPLAPTLPPACHLRTLPRAQAITQFIHLYEQSFGPHPWYQPYSSAEVAAALGQTKDLLFLYHQDEPIGFVWAQSIEKGLAEIEPVGILTQWQGEGYGRFLLQSAIYNLAQRGAAQISIGTWLQNRPALHLYHSLGFQPDHTLIYLAYEV